jgi:mycoredoxin-dependent peroxiredoxin
MSTLRPHITPVTVGEVAPDFTLKDQNRAEWKLSEAVKKGDVVLCFFPLAFTGTCSIEMKCITDEMSKWQSKGSTVVGISCDSFASLKAWADHMNLKQTLLADMHREVCKAYGLYWPDLNCSTRGTIVIGKDASGNGKIKWIQAREPGAAMNFDEVLAHVG